MQHQDLISACRTECIDSARGQRLVEVFRTATRMEVAFWQQGLNVLQEKM